MEPEPEGKAMARMFFISIIKRRKGLAWTAFWKLERLWRCPNISISTKIKLFNTTCVTVLLYGCESWVLSKAMESKINAFGTSCYRIMLNIKRIDRVSNAKIYDLTKTAPLVETVRTHQRRFLGDVLRMPDDEPCKEYALYIPPNGKRKEKIRLGSRHFVASCYSHFVASCFTTVHNGVHLIYYSHDIYLGIQTCRDGEMFQSH